MLTGGTHRALIGRVALFAWFLAIDASYATGMFADGSKVGVDATIYTSAARAWLAGAAPYAVTATGVPFGAAPPTLFLYVPFTLLPLGLERPVLIALALAAGVWAIRRMKLPLWWLAFPPMATGIALGNAQPIALALLLTSGPVGDALAVTLKLYAGLPPLILGRWRGLLLAGVLFAVTIPILPWGAFLAARGLGDQFAVFTLNGSAAGFGPGAIVITAIALATLGRTAAAWLSVPALWPSAQTYYAVFAMPVLRPWMAAIVALPWGGVVPLAVIVAALVEVLVRGRRLSPASRGTAASGEPVGLTGHAAARAGSGSAP